MKKETTKKVSSDNWINVHDDKVMCEMGFPRYAITPRDESVWIKTEKERETLKKLKHTCKNWDSRCYSIPLRRATVNSKLIITLKRNKVFPKSVYSQMCLNTSISDALEKFLVIDPVTGWKESVVAKYYYNGREYYPNELPYYK